MTKFCVALTFDDVSTIWVYKASIIRMVGRLFVSLEEELGTISHIVCGDMPVYPRSKPSSSIQSYQTATPLPEVTPGCAVAY
jgi:hypothetical protein